MNTLPTTPPAITRPASPSGSLTDAIAQVESGFGYRMRSHDGNSIGWHMMSKAAWSDVDKRRASRSLPLYPRTNAFDYQVSSAYCSDYLRLLNEKLSDALHRKPSQDEVLCAYRAGFTGFKRLDFNVSHYSAYCRAVHKYLK